MSTEWVPAISLVEDFDLYPRESVDTTHISDMVRAREAGVSLPPVIADRASRRLVDGWHRRRAVLRFEGEDAVIEVEWRDYEGEAAIYADAVQLNASHGRKLTRWDHARIKLRADELGIPTRQIAVLIHRPPEYVVKSLPVAIRRTNGETISVALKRPFRHFEGQTMTTEQASANERSSGWPAVFHANQLAMLIEADALIGDEGETAALLRLRTALAGLEL